jgi:hypothetical protein
MRRITEVDTSDTRAVMNRIRKEMKNGTIKETLTTISHCQVCLNTGEVLDIKGPLAAKIDRLLIGDDK